jgi:hypothetical protein
MTHLSLLGEALSEFYYRKITDEPLHYIRNSDGFCADFDMAEWFETVYFPAIESDAMSMCRGAVLDLGAAAGRHSLALQSRGIVDVCAVDILSTAVEIMRLRGVQNAFVLDVMDRTLYSIGDRSSSNNTAQHSSSSSSSSSSSATVSSQSLQFMDNDEPRLNLDAPMFNEHADNKGRTLADHVKALLRKRYDVDDWTRCTATGVFDTIIMLVSLKKNGKTICVLKVGRRATRLEWSARLVVCESCYST